MRKIKSISKRLTLIFSFLTVLSILFTGVFTSYIFSRVVIDKAVHIVDKEMDTATEELDQQIISIKSMYSRIKSNGEIQELMEKDDASDKMQLYERSKQISKIFKQYPYYDSTINSIIAFDKNMNVLDPKYMEAPYDGYIRGYQEFKDFVKSGKYDEFSKPSLFPYNTSINYQHSKDTITYFVQYLGKNDFTVKGYVMINVFRNSMFKIIDQYSSNVFDVTYILNDKNELIYNIGDSELDLETIKNEISSDKNSYKIKNVRHKSYIIFSKTLKNYPKWKVVGAVSYWKATKDLELLYWVIAIFCIICICIVILLSYRISKGITDPIVKISQSIESFSNNVWPDKIKPETEDEVKHLVVGFNDLFEYLETLLGKIHYEHEEKEKAEVKSYKLQLQLLQSQINPHFMHNTLNTAAYLALQKGDYEVREVIQSLNALFRISMNIDKNMISIAEELTFINNYLKIQQYRYDNIFIFHHEVSQEVRRYLIPKLILQPLIENALFHGILPKKTHGTISLHIRRAGDKIEFEVIDDGVGIQNKNIGDVIINNHNDDAPTGYNKIGLFNINERLSLYYNEDSKLNIFSNTGIGTSVKFYIPCNFE